MARHKIRLFHGQKHVFIKGEPLAEISHFLYLREADGYWLMLWKLKALDRERRRKEKEERRARRTRAGSGSGRAGGGRGAAHTRFHFRDGEVSWGTKPGNCPLCLGKKLWRLWLRTDYGRLPGWWDSGYDREELEVCNREFDRYMRGHRFEHRTIKVNTARRHERPDYRYYLETDVFLAFGCPGSYDRIDQNSLTEGDRIVRFDRLLIA